jgi:DNA (cytosine-5)-methyltransferase 1
MKYGSVCSGIEAATVAWHPLGWQPSFFSEIDAAPRKVLAHHYPNVPCHGDFTTIKENSYDAIDLLVGGTPCQAFSVAGLRKGFSDDRGNLTLEFIRLAERLKPRWLVWENVPGVLSIDGGRAFGSFLGGLGQLGYGTAYRVLDAQYFGVPQRRRRVFVVGYLGDWRPAAAVLFERESLRGDITPSREALQGTPCAFETGPQGGGFTDLAPTLDVRCKNGPIQNQLGVGICMAHGQGGAEIAFDKSPSLTCNHEAPILAPGGRFVDGVSHSLRGEGHDASEDGTGRGVPLEPDITRWRLRQVPCK